MTSLEPKTYANGVGILIGEDNVVSIDEEWFDEWFDAKIEELIGKLSALEGEVSEVKENVEKAILEYELKNYSETEKYCLKALQIRTHENT